MHPPDEQFEAPVSATDGAVRLWSAIARGLQQQGYAKAAPEYLKLSRLLANARKHELLRGQTPEAPHWAKIRRAAAAAAELLRPLLESAELLANLPVAVSPAPAPVGAAPPPEVEPVGRPTPEPSAKSELQAKSIGDISPSEQAVDRKRRKPEPGQTRPQAPKRGTRSAKPAKSRGPAKGVRTASGTRRNSPKPRNRD